MSATVKSAIYGGKTPKEWRETPAPPPRAQFQGEHGTFGDSGERLGRRLGYAADLLERINQNNAAMAPAEAVEGQHASPQAIGSTVLEACSPDRNE